MAGEVCHLMVAGKERKRNRKEPRARYSPKDMLSVIYIPS
jgi:hypothetical protein